jgi:hypothetical protein
LCGSISSVLDEGLGRLSEICGNSLSVEFAIAHKHRPALNPELFLPRQNADSMGTVNPATTFASIVYSPDLGLELFINAVVDKDGRNNLVVTLRYTDCIDGGARC